LFLFYFCLWFVLLFCRLLQGDLGELLLVMECDPDCSMKTFHELCESWLVRGLARSFRGSQGTRSGGGYMMLAEETRGGRILVKKGS
jgi:hypothetical protein